MNSAGEAAEKSKESLKSSDEVFLEYHLRLAMHDWEDHGSKIGCLRNLVKHIVLSHWYQQLLNVAVLINTLILMTNHHGISDEWLLRNLKIETGCLIFFWSEFIMKVMGFGFSAYIESATHRLDFFVLLATSAGFIASVLSVLSAILPVDAPGAFFLGDSLNSLSSIRLVRLMRTLQVIL